ncbi:MAG: alpha/beta hydrolase [Nanoarchaeota archaeon]
MKRVFIIHGWGGSPQERMIASIAHHLELRGLEVHVLTMPHTNEPTISEWVAHLVAEVGTIDKDTFFVGHSIGCQTILRFLEKQKRACGGAVFVAGWFTLQGLETPEEEAIAAPWLETSFDYEKIKKNLPRSVAIFSDNDPFVPLDNKDIFRAKLGSEIIVEDNKGHFTEGDGAVESITVCNALLRLANA